MRKATWLVFCELILAFLVAAIIPIVAVTNINNEAQTCNARKNILVIGKNVISCIDRRSLLEENE